MPKATVVTSTTNAKRCAPTIKTNPHPMKNPQSRFLQRPRQRSRLRSVVQFSGHREHLDLFTLCGFRKRDDDRVLCRNETADTERDPPVAIHKELMLARLSRATRLSCSSEPAVKSVEIPAVVAAPIRKRHRKFARNAHDDNQLANEMQGRSTLSLIS